MKTVSNLTRVAEVIAEHNADGECNEPECMAYDLKYADLIKPDLPEPLPGDYPSWETEYYRIEVKDDLVAVVDDIGEIDYLTTEETRRLAHSLLAAAEHVEKENPDEQPEETT